MELTDKRHFSVDDIMTTYGMGAAGNQTIDIDDCWQMARDINRLIVPDPLRFSNCCKSLAKYD